MPNTSWSGTRTPIPKATRQRILRRDSYTCQACHGALCGNTSLQVDHSTPVAEGGTDDDSNLATIGAEPCHRRKTEAERKRGLARRNPKRRPEPHPGMR